MNKSAYLVLIMTILFATALFSIPNQINYRGKLFESGAPVTGSRNMEFRVFNALTGGTQLWTSGAIAINVNAGLYNYTMGTNPVIPVSVFTNDFTYLEVVVGGTALAPRERFVAVPYAYKAEVSKRVINASNAAAGRVLTSDVNGYGKWLDSSSTIGGFGTANYLSKFKGAGLTITNSLFYEINSQIGLGILSPRTGSKLHVENRFNGTKSGIVSVVSNTATGLDYDNIAIIGFGIGAPGYSFPVGVMGIAHPTASFQRAYGVYAGLDTSIPATATNVKTAFFANAKSLGYSGIFQGGNVGIGTIAPQKLLDVLGTARVSANSTPVFTVSNTSTLGSISFLDAAGNSWFKSGNVGIGSVSPASPLHIEKSGAWEPMILARSPDNDVSIRLDSRSATGGESYLEIANTYTGLLGWGMGLNDNSFLQFGYGPLGTMNKTRFPLTFNTNGSVGIGTDYPIDPFEVFQGPLSLSYDDTASGSARMIFRERSPGYQYKWAFVGSADTYATAAEQNAIGFFQYNDKAGAAVNLYRLLINDAGNVGIGTTTPSQQLEITGNFVIPSTTATSGIIYMGASTFLHSYGSGGLFLGLGAGNLTHTGVNNVGIGDLTLALLSTGQYNTAVGYNAGHSIDAGTYNSAFGYQALPVSVGSYNTAFGASSQRAATGSYNTSLGYYSLYNVTGSYNIGIGYYAGDSLTAGANNILIGYYAGQSLTTTGNNLMLGYGAGYNNIGTGNVFLGYQAGYNETGSDKLYIDNSSTTNPLIWGDFAGNIVAIKGRLGVGTNAPSEMLEVVSNVTANDYRYNATKTSYASFPASAFHIAKPSSTVSAYLHTNSYWIPGGTSTTNSFFQAPLMDVPHGAYITTILFYVYSAAGTFPVTGDIKRRSSAALSLADWHTIYVAAAPSGASSITVTVNEAIDKGTYEYVLMLTLPTSGAYRFYGARVTYTMDRASF